MTTMGHDINELEVVKKNKEKQAKERKERISEF